MNSVFVRFWMFGFMFIAMACGGDFQKSCCAGPQLVETEQQLLPQGLMPKRQTNPVYPITPPAGRLGAHRPTPCTGRLAVAVDGDTPITRLGVSNTLSLPALKIRFGAVCESFRIPKLRLINTSAADSVTASGLSDDMVTLITMSYPMFNGEMLSASAVLVNGVADFSSLNLYAPAYQSTIVSVQINVMDINLVTGRTSPKIVRIGFDFGTAEDSNFEAIGERSGIRLTTGAELIAGVGFTNNTAAKAADIVGNPIMITKSQPRVVLAAATPSGAAVPGLNEVLRYTVCADVAGSIELKRNTFSMRSTDQRASGWNKATDSLGSTMFRLYNTDDLSIAVEGQWTLWSDSGYSFNSPSNIGYARFDWQRPQSIAAGTCKTFALKVDTSGASSTTANSDTVRFDVAGDEVAVCSLGGNGVFAGQYRGSSFIWGETGINAVSTLSGFTVRHIPITGGVVHY